MIQNETQTFGLAVGLVYQGNRPGDVGDDFQLPPFARWDGGAYYQRGFLRASVYVENIFDRQYYLSSLNNLQIFPVAPVNVRAQVGVTY